MSKESQFRRVQLTFNNAQSKGLTHDVIKAGLDKFQSLLYACMADEIGLETQTPHTHVYAVFQSPIRFSTLKKRFPEAHIEVARGSAQENRDYVAKTGKWQSDPKADSSVKNTFQEFGELPVEKGQGFRSDLLQLYSLIVDGHSNASIIAQNPDLAIHISRMDKIRQDHLEALYREKFRELSVTYIFGPTGTGKTRGVLEKEGYSSVFRVTDYEHPFDRYGSEPAILFDEFRSSLRIQDMLMYLDGYPLNLPARYAHRVACYSEVYIISNIDLKEQYPNIQLNEPETWNAFLRRIGQVVEYRKDGPPINHGSAQQYVKAPKKYPAWVEEADGPYEELPL